MTKPKSFESPKFSYNKATLDEYCKNNNVIITNDISNKINRDTKIEGNCSNLTCVNKFYKTLRILLDNNNYCNSCIREKTKIERNKNLNIITQKQRETCMKKYGVSNFLNLIYLKIKQKILGQINMVMIIPLNHH